MAPRREILDSDDEDEDFSPVKDAVAPPRVGDGNDHGNDIQETPRHRRAESTDPSFFRKVYDGQVGADAQQSTSSVAALGSSELVSTFSPNPPPNVSHTAGHHDTSSITDPVPASRQKKTQSEGMKEAVVLTQVTTPGRPTPSIPVDIWDIPPSPPNASAAAASFSAAQALSTEKKVTVKPRKAAPASKSTLSSSIQSPEAQPSSGLLPALSVAQTEQTPDEPRQKRRRLSSTGQQAVASQEVDLLVIPRSDEKPAGGTNFVPPIDNSSSIVENSLRARRSSLLVVPSTTMTPSQRDEYRYVSLSSEADRGLDHLELPRVGQTDDLQKSSGSATIKYPTPTQYASSGRRAPDPAEYGTAASNRPKRRRNVNVADSEPHSSPDVISVPAVTPRERRVTKRAPRDRAVEDDLLLGHPDVEDQSTPVRKEPPQKKTRGRKRKEIPSPTEEEDALPDTAPAHTEERSTRVGEEKTRGRKRKEISVPAVEQEALPDTAPAQTEEEPTRVDGEVTEAPTEPAPKKRRGRPRREPQRQAIVIDSDDEADEIVQPDPEEAPTSSEPEIEEPRPKKRRGRPKKADVVKSAGKGVPSDMQQDEEGNDETTHTTEAKRSRKTTAKNTTTTDDKAAALSERDSNSNLGASPTKQGATPEQEAVEQTAKENQLAEGKAKKDVVKETKAGTPGSSQMGKVQYRIGLSKRTRIPPLLKSFRK